MMPWRYDQVCDIAGFSLKNHKTTWYFAPIFYVYMPLTHRDNLGHMPIHLWKFHFWPKLHVPDFVCFSQFFSGHFAFFSFFFFCLLPMYNIHNPHTLNWFYISIPIKYPHFTLNFNFSIFDKSYKISLNSPRTLSTLAKTSFEWIYWNLWKLRKFFPPLTEFRITNHDHVSAEWGNF